MIISASRRTDIPAFYARWFINRIRAGFCTVPNPFDAGQITRVSLTPEDVDVIIFWTRNPRPLFPYLSELDQSGYRYYFQYTLMANPRLIDPGCPPADTSIKTFRDLAELIGPDRVIWRYDPIVFSEITPDSFHRETYARLARAFHGCTRRSVISILDMYPKIRPRLEQIKRQGAGLLPFDVNDAWFGELMRHIVAEANENGMGIVSCAEELDLAQFGIRPGKCVDDNYISQVFGLEVAHTKDPNQRKACGCVVSKDIGAYDSCLFGCTYCYATQNFERARRRHGRHNPDSTSLIE